VDVVRGAGRHRIASRLHLHPDAPDDLQIAALGGALRRDPAPLHERFGETRAMTRLVVEVEAALPWAGGFRIGFGAAPTTAPVVSLDGAVARLRTDDFEVAWRLDARDAGAVAIETRAG